MTRIAVITPYYREGSEVLQRCHESVVSQRVDVDHFLVADGFPNLGVAHWRAKHVVLPVAHGDNGNTPRGIGGLLASAEGYEYIAYLDADNWYHPDHLQTLLALHGSTSADVCCSLRTFHQLNGEEMPVRELDEDEYRHVDTSCVFLHRSAFDCLSLWLQMPKQLSPLCDRVFMQGLIQKRCRFAFSGKRTVAFRSQYRAHYVAAGLPPPSGCKDDVATEPRRWLHTSEGARETARRLGFFPL